MLSELLTRARKHVAGGWSPLLSRDASGLECGPDEEGITTFCIVDALITAADGDLVVMQTGARALGLRLSPTKLGDWEAAPERTQVDVLELFALAAKNAATKEHRS